MILQRVENPDFLSNAYFVCDGPGGSGVLVDSNGVTDPLAERAEREGTEVTHLLLTHHHWDHVLEAEALAERFGVPILAHEKTAELLDGVVTETFADGDVISSGDLRLEVMHTPGHCADHCALRIDDTDVLTADVLFAGTVGGTRAPGATGFEDLKRSVMELMKLDHSDPHPSRASAAVHDRRGVGAQPVRAGLAWARRGGSRGGLDRPGRRRRARRRDAHPLGAGLRRRQQGVDTAGVGRGCDRRWLAGEEGGLSVATILCVLYDDPVDGYPPAYPRDEIPAIEGYPDGQSAPTPDGIDFTPGELLGSVSGALGLHNFCEAAGHTLVVTADKDGPDSEFERTLPEAEVVISQPFWPAYLTAERIAKAENLKLALTAGIGSDHVDLQAAMDAGVTVAEVTYCNSISVAEHVVMMILSLVRNYIPSYQTVVDGGWNIADCASRSYDVEGMQVGTVAAGRIGSAVLRRLKPFDVGLHYTDRHRLPADVERELGVTFHDSPEGMVGVCDVVTINAPLHPETEHLFDDAMIARMKRGSYIVNTARGKICDRDAIARALESGQLAGYAGDVWFPQPAPEDHPWRTMPNHGMTPHVSGTSLSAQARYAAGVREILENHFAGRSLRDEYLIVEGGRLAGTGAHSYSEGDATSGSEEAARFGR